MNKTLHSSKSLRVVTVASATLRLLTQPITLQFSVCKDLIHKTTLLPDLTREIANLPPLLLNRLLESNGRSEIIFSRKL
jgi:hypothetical protein